MPRLPLKCFWQQLVRQDLIWRAGSSESNYRSAFQPQPSKELLGLLGTGDPEGRLYGEVLVFTGALAITRSEAADMAAKIGCTVADGVNKKTTMLVVGDQDVRELAGQEQSSKHRKAEDLILKGQAIRILRETDFKELVSLAV